MVNFDNKSKHKRKDKFIINKNKTKETVSFHLSIETNQMCTLNHDQWTNDANIYKYSIKVVVVMRQALLQLQLLSQKEMIYSDSLVQILSNRLRLIHFQCDKVLLIYLLIIQ